ncbi:MAG: hypothetical protein H3C42_08660, partial [Phycisphaerae bacterium]|nr:hypothetical protein [Phycisphaerae bacterium]
MRRALCVVVVGVFACTPLVAYVITNVMAPMVINRPNDNTHYRFDIQVSGEFDIWDDLTPGGTITVPVEYWDGDVLFDDVIHASMSFTVAVPVNAQPGTPWTVNVVGLLRCGCTTGTYWCSPEVFGPSGFTGENPCDDGYFYFPGANGRQLWGFNTIKCGAAGPTQGALMPMNPIGPGVDSPPHAHSPDVPPLCGREPETVLTFSEEAPRGRKVHRYSWSPVRADAPGGIAGMSPDECLSHETIDCNGTYVVNNSIATDSITDPGFSCFWDGTGARGNGTLWFRFQATDARVRIRTCSTASPVDDTLSAVYSGCCDSLVEIGCGEDGCGVYHHDYYVNVVPGEFYLIQLATNDGYSARGDITMELQCLPALGPVCTG